MSFAHGDREKNETSEQNDKALHRQIEIQKARAKFH